MAATNLNTVRSTIETRIRNEFRTGQPIPLVFNNVPLMPLLSINIFNALLALDQVNTLHSNHQVQAPLPQILLWVLLLVIFTQNRD